MGLEFFLGLSVAKLSIGNRHWLLVTVYSQLYKSTTSTVRTCGFDMVASHDNCFTVLVLVE
jgi:hypothetical protein